MAQIVKLRRSSVSGQKPTNSNLQLGELALNTTDGKVYMAKSGSLGPSVEELITTNAVNTGSITISGSINLLGNQSITGSLIVSDGVGYINTGLIAENSDLVLTSGSDIHVEDGGIVSASQIWGDGSHLINIPTSGVTDLTIISGSLDNRLDALEFYSSSQQVPTASYALRTTQTDVYVKNMSGAQINKGTVVRIVGSVGDNPLIGVADFLTEGQSANTLGIATQDIPNDSFGLVITEGVLIGVNTSGMTAGQLLYLDGDGTFTTNYPVAPNHGVRLGEVLRVHQNNGSIYVRIDNGSELGEAHNVVDTTTNSSYGDLLVKSGSVWVNSKSLNGDYNVTGSLTITQNLTVLGSSSLVYVTSSYLTVSASFISVNVFEPAERFGGLKVYDSGSSNATASLAWDSFNNHWVYQNSSGSSYSGAMLLSGPRNSGSLGEEVGLISGRIPKSVGDDHLDNSIISETGDVITVYGDLVANSITGSFDFYGLNNRPTLVSGSSQIEITGTTGYSEFSGSISSSIGELSSSVATTTFNVENRLDSIEGVTGSYATTGSNVFIGNQTITGSLFVSNSLYIGSGVNDIVRIKALISSSLIPDSDGLHHFVGTQDKRWEGVFAKTGSFNEIHGNLGSVVNIYHATVSGSFTGDGTGLYNIPASGVTGLQLDKIINGNASASIDDTGLYVNRDVYIDGSLTAKELHIDYVTSSVLYQSGSTKFGDSADDTHMFTGSVFISNSLFVGGGFNDIVRIKALISSSLIPDSDGIHHFVGAQDRRWEGVFGKTGSFSEIHGNLGSVVNIFNTTASGSFSGSFMGNGSGLLDVPFLISGSNIYGTTVNKTFTKLQFDDSTGLNVEETTPGTAFISIGSHFKDIFVSGSPILSATGSDAFEIIPTGGIEITTSTTDTNSNGYVKELNISATSLSSSLNDRMDVITGSITSLSSSINTTLDTVTGSITSLSSSINTTLDILTGSVDSLNLFTSSVVLTSETGSMTVLSSSYALTASFALNAGGGAEGRSAKLTQSSPATTWTFDHNLGEQYPEVTVYDSLGYVVIPTNILAYSNNQMIITFSSAQSGTVTATVGGGLPAISASYAGYVLSNNGTSPSWKSGMVSGSLQISEFGYATTGSNTFTNNQIINGTLTINNAKVGTVCTSLPSTTTVLNLSTFDGVSMDYVIKKSGNMRAGNVMGVWSGSDVKYSETSTMDIGDTSEFTFTINNTGAVTANFTSGTWVVEIFYRAIGGCI